MVKPALIKALTPHSFEMQCIGPDVYLVWKSETTGLYERVELRLPVNATKSSW